MCDLSTRCFAIAEYLDAAGWEPEADRLTDCGVRLQRLELDGRDDAGGLPISTLAYQVGTRLWAARSLHADAVMALAGEISALEARPVHRVWPAAVLAAIAAPGGNVVPFMRRGAIREMAEVGG